jgi:hypothetical protein
MVYILGKTLQLISIELGEYYGKDSREIDADTIIPYLVYIVIEGIAQVKE